MVSVVPGHMHTSPMVAIVVTAMLLSHPGVDAGRDGMHTCMLVDPASCHMFVSKIKPCKSNACESYSYSCERLIKTVVIYPVVEFPKSDMDVVILPVIRVASRRVYAASEACGSFT